MPPPIPSWLQKAYNQDHITNVWRILSDREYSRICARSFQIPAGLPRPCPHNYLLALIPNGNLADHYSTALGCSLENQCRNRYSDIQPYDRTLWAIATQAPASEVPLTNSSASLPASIIPLTPPGDPSSKFTRVRTVVQLTPYLESGRQKAHPYFPFEPGESRRARTAWHARCPVAPTSGEEPIIPVVFRHLLYGAWPDNGIPEPEDRASLLRFIKVVDSTNKDLSGLEATADVEPPIMVHCSAGVGRTGSFIALCSLLRSNGLFSAPNPNTAVRAAVHPLPQSPLGPLPESISWDKVSEEVDSLREQRPGMVQRPEQVLLVYEILIGAFILMAKGNVIH
ncbi:phosphatases II [Lactarius deliciosus]|nr:phosphatases II [Lactarius deliciosus]